MPTASALTLAGGGAMLLPWITTDHTALTDTATLGLILWLGLASTALAYWLFSAGIIRMSATTVGTLSLAEPLAAAGIGVLILNEHLTTTALIGCALILGGLIKACTPTPRRHTHAAEHNTPHSRHTSVTR